MWRAEDLPAVPLICALEKQPRTVITLTPSRVLIDVEQALFSVTDVSFAVPKPHFPSISNGQVSVCTALEGPSQGHLISKDRKALRWPKGLPSTSMKDLNSITTSCLQEGETGSEAYGGGSEGFGAFGAESNFKPESERPHWSLTTARTSRQWSTVAHPQQSKLSTLCHPSWQSG